MRMRLLLEATCVQLLLILCVSHASAGCLNPPLSQQAIDQFKADPKGLVTSDTDARTVEALVRDIAGTDALLAVDLVHVAETAQPRFRTAIAAGLAQATRDFLREPRPACCFAESSRPLLVLTTGNFRHRLPQSPVISLPRQPQTPLSLRRMARWEA